MAFSLTKRVSDAFYYNFFLRRNNVNFKSKAVLITGCDSGLGYNFAVHLNSKGVRVFAGVLNETSPGARDLKCKDIEVVPIDVTKTESVVKAATVVKDALAERECDFFGLVNNAGTMVVGEFEWLTEDMVKRQISVNLLGPMVTIKHFLPLLRQQNGRIVNVTSHCAGFALPGMSVYSSSKFGLRGFSLGLNRELDKFNIKVVEFIPGSFVTHSGIMSNQQEYSSSMSKHMSPDVRQVYKDYFNRYASYLSNLPVPKPGQFPCLIDDIKLYDKLESAIFSKNPRLIYINEPPRYFIYYTLFSILPESSLKQYLVKKFINMPEF